MEINKNKVFTILYALSVFSLFGVMFACLYNLTFGKALTSSPPHLFIETTILCIILAGITFVSVILNMFTKDKLFWVEIACASVSLITLIILLIFNGKNTYAASLQLIWFELLSVLAMLLITRLCGKFLKKQEQKTLTIENVKIDDQKDTIPVQETPNKNIQKKPVSLQNKKIKKSLIIFIVCTILFISSFCTSLILIFNPVGSPVIAFKDDRITSCYYDNSSLSDNYKHWVICAHYNYKVSHRATYEIIISLYKKSDNTLLSSVRKQLNAYPSSSFDSSYYNYFYFYAEDDSAAYTTDSFYVTFSTINVTNVVKPEVSETRKTFGYVLIPATVTFLSSAIYYLVDLIKIKKQKNSFDL